MSAEHINRRFKHRRDDVADMRHSAARLINGCLDLTVNVCKQNTFYNFRFICLCVGDIISAEVFLCREDMQPRI